MSKLSLTHKETERRAGEYLPSTLCVKAWHFQLIFLLKFSSDLQRKARLTWNHWPQAGLLLTLEKVVCISSWLEDQRQLRH